VLDTRGKDETIQKIFAGVLIGGLDKRSEIFGEKVRIAKTCVHKFLATFPRNIFFNEYAIFHEIIAGLKVKVFTPDQLDEILDANRNLILSSPYIDWSKYNVIGGGYIANDDEKIEVLRLNLKDILKSLSETLVTEAEFESSCAVYIEIFKKLHMFNTAQNMVMIMGDAGFEERKAGGRLKKYQGLEDTESYYNERLQVLREFRENGKVTGEVINQNWFNDEIRREKIEDDKALMTIGLKEIDDTLGELRRSNVLGILGPPKGGKTRFTNFIVSKALMQGLNVCVWALEGTQEEWVAMQTACYIRRITGASYNSKDILQRKFKNNPDKLKLIVSAKMALAMGQGMGKLSFISGVAYVEDFIDVIENHYNNENQFDIIVIDSLLNVMSRKNQNKSERISEAYMQVKNLVANKLKRQALAILPAQLKQSVVDKLRANPDETLDVTAGGESAETIRTPDEVVGLFSSKEERAAGISHLYSVASRHSGNFEDFLVRSDFQCCYFSSDTNLN